MQNVGGSLGSMQRVKYLTPRTRRGPAPARPVRLYKVHLLLQPSTIQYASPRQAQNRPVSIFKRATMYDETVPRAPVTVHVYFQLCKREELCVRSTTLNTTP